MTRDAEETARSNAMAKGCLHLNHNPEKKNKNKNKSQAECINCVKKRLLKAFLYTAYLLMSYSDDLIWHDV